MAVLKMWDGSGWVAAPNGAVVGIDDLSDVTLTSAADNDFLQRKSGLWVNRTPAQALTDLGAQPLDSDLTAIAALAPADGSLMGRSGGAWVGRSPANAKTDLSLDKVLNIKDNYSSAVPPTVSDDSSQGYSVGSRWVDTLTHITYYCASASVGAALWIKLNFISSVASPLVESGGGLSIDTTAFKNGYLPFVLPIGTSLLSSFNTQAIPAAGGTLLVPMIIPAQMYVRAVTLRNLDTTLARSWEWKLYNDDASGNLTAISGLDGSESFTATVASNRTANATTPSTVNPGVYWIGLRNSHASNVFTIASQQVSAANPAWGTNLHHTKTLAGGLVSPLDAITGWAANAVTMPLPVIVGRAFGANW